MADPKKPKRVIRPPSQVAEGAILKMPLGQLNALAARLVEADRATAEYLRDKISAALQPAS